MCACVNVCVRPCVRDCVRACVRACVRPSICVCQGHGYMYVFADLPLGPSYERQKVLGKVGLHSARSYPIKKFYNNAAHSYKRVGHFFLGGGEGL